MTRLSIPVLLLAASLALWPVGAALGDVLYVDASAPPNGDGSSWETAYRDLQDALDDARVDGSVDQIWVAQGTYLPDRGTQDRLESFELVSGVAVLGGFAGGEESSDDRDPDAHPTILSGDLQQNDLPDFGNYADNSQHVIYGVDLSTCRLDGFTVRGGNADLDGGLLLGGGGMLVASTSESGDTTSIVVEDCLFTENSAGQTFAELGNFGGGLLLRATSGRVAHCRFEHNRANAGGALGLFDRNLGGVDVDMAVSIHDCDFIENFVPTQGGGAFYSALGHTAIGDEIGYMTVRRCNFEGNTAGYWGAWVDNNTTFLTIEDCVFRGNSSDVEGGALGHIQTAGPDEYPAQIRRSVFEDNHADIGGGGIWMGAADAVIDRCIFRRNTAYHGGGMRSGTYFTPYGSQDLFMTNCLFDGNTAFAGGALYSYDNPTFRLANCTFVHNEAIGDVTGGVVTGASVVDIDNSIFWENTGQSGPIESAQVRHYAGGNMSINHCLIEGLTGGLGGIGNIDGPPLFVDEFGMDGLPGTDDEDLGLASGSPCIDAADNDAVPDSISLDLAGAPRIVDGDGDELDDVDMGAYEFQGGVVDVAGGGERPAGTRLLGIESSQGRSLVHYELAGPALVRLSVFDVTGRRIRVLAAERQTAGTHVRTWNGTDGAGRRVASGVYFVELLAGGSRDSGRILRLER